MRRETGVTHDLQYSNTIGLTIRGALGGDEGAEGRGGEGRGGLLTSYFTISLLIVFSLTNIR